MLSKVSHTEKDKCYMVSFVYGLYSSTQRIAWWGPGEWVNWGDVGQMIQNSSSKMSKIWGPHVQHGDYR